MKNTERKRIHGSHFGTDHSEIADQLVFNFHTDAAHGWIAVKKDLVRELEIQNKISAYSYMKGKTAYLEEDRDAGIFIKAFKEKFNIEPKIKELEPREKSPIRSFYNFSMK